MSFDPVSYLIGKQAGGGGGFSPSDEGKVVSNGALVAQTDETVTVNGVVDTTTIKQVTVDVSAEPDMTVTAKQFKLLINYDDYYGPYLMNFGQTVASGCTIDWGDGTVETSRDAATDFGVYQFESPYSHAYKSNERYLVTVTAKQGDLYILGYGNIGSLLAINPYGLVNNVQFTMMQKAVLAMITEIAIGESVLFYNNALGQMPFLKSNRVLGEATDGVLPVTVQNSFLQNDVIIPEGVTAVAAYCFSNTMVKTVVAPSTLREIRDHAFSNMYATTLYDFTAIDLIDGAFPVTLANTSSIYCRNGAPLTSIRFKSKEVADAAKAATNWSNFAAYIHYVGEE